MKNLLYFELDPRGHDGRIHFTARLRMADAIRSSRASASFSKKLVYIEKRYGALVRAGRGIYDKIARAKPGQRLFLYWELADRLDKFLKTAEKQVLFLNYPHRHFARDLGVSTRTIAYLLRFRRSTRRRSALDPSRPWSHYVMAPNRPRKCRSRSMFRRT